MYAVCDFLHTLSYFLVMNLSGERKEIPPNTFLRLSNYALQLKEDPRAASVLLYLLKTFALSNPN